MAQRTPEEAWGSANTTLHAHSFEFHAFLRNQVKGVYLSSLVVSKDGTLAQDTLLMNMIEGVWKGEEGNSEVKGPHSRSHSRKNKH